MNSLNLKKQILIIGLLLLQHLSYSQADKKGGGNNSLSIKFSTYSVETDQLVQKEFTKNDGYRSVYTCIPAGIVVIGNLNGVLPDKDIIKAKIQSIKQSLNYEILEGQTIKQAEENCSSKRNLEK